MLVVKVTNLQLKMSTCPSGSILTDEDTYGNQYARSIVRQKYACKLQELLYQQTLQNSDFCDVQLNIDGSVMKAHWCVLVICPYFQSLYDSGMKESVSGKLTLNFGVPYAMRDAIKFLYTGEVQVRMERVKDLLEVADYLQITEMTEICVQFLKSIKLTLENCVQILLLSSLHNLSTYDIAFKFVSGHLPELMSGKDLMDFTKSSLLSLVSDATLSYVKREDFFNFIVRWTEHDVEHRQKDFEELFCALDLYPIPPACFAEKIEQHTMVARSEKCQMHCIEKKLKGMVGAAAGASQMQDVVILGGGAPKDSRYRFLFMPKTINVSLYAFLVRQERWVRLPELPYCICKPLLATTEEGDLLVVDSDMIEGSEKRKQLLKLCPVSNTWSSTKLVFPVSETDFMMHALLTIGGRVFFVASSKTRVQPAPPRFNQNQPHRNQPPQAMLFHWHVQLLELNKETGVLSVMCGFFQRVSQSEIHAVCQQAHNGTTLDGGVIYVLGHKVMGWKAKGKHKATKFFVYDLQINRAKEVYGGKMSYEPLAVGMTEGFLSCRMGKVTNKFFNQAQRRVQHNNNYNLKLLPKDAGRTDFSHVAVDDEVYIFGGKQADSQESCMSACKFSFATQTWTELTDLPCPFVSSGITRGRMSLEALSCHLECPHCYYTPLKDRTTYNVPYATRERAESPPHFYDMDDSDGTDDDYDLDYDDFEPSYSDDGWGPYLDPDEYDLFDLF